MSPTLLSSEFEAHNERATVFHIDYYIKTYNSYTKQTSDQIQGLYIISLATVLDQQPLKEFLKLLLGQYK